MPSSLPRFLLAVLVALVTARSTRYADALTYPHQEPLVHSHIIPDDSLSVAGGRANYLSLSQPSRTLTFSSSLLSMALDEEESFSLDYKSWNDALRDLRFETDEVVRVIDANTVKLKRAGLVSFAAIQTPSGYKDDFRFPDCMSKSPASKAKQLLPQGTKVQVRLVDDSSRPKALVMLRDSGKVVNFELVKEGFARPLRNRGGMYEKELPGFQRNLETTKKQAEEMGLGMFKRCDAVEIAADDQFEEMEFTTEIQYGDDGGKTIIRKKDAPAVQPPNPIPVDNTLPLRYIRKCADFNTYEDALRWYEKYYPYYGDVAQLDKDGDGVPCSGLPHTTNPERYRLKKPNNIVSAEKVEAPR